MHSLSVNISKSRRKHARFHNAPSLLSLSLSFTLFSSSCSIRANLVVIAFAPCGCKNLKQTVISFHYRFAWICWHFVQISVLPTLSILILHECDHQQPIWWPINALRLRMHVHNQNGHNCGQGVQHDLIDAEFAFNHHSSSWKFTLPKIGNSFVSALGTISATMSRMTAIVNSEVRPMEHFSPRSCDFEDGVNMPIRAMDVMRITGSTKITV